MACTLDETDFEDDYPREKEPELYSAIEQRQLVDGLRTSVLSGSGQQRYLMLLQALLYLFGTATCPGISIIGRELCVRFKLTHTRAWSGSSNNQVSVDYQSRVIVAIVRGKMTPSVDGNDTVQFGRYFVSASNPVHAFLREEARDEIEVVYDKVFTGAGDFHGFFDTTSNVSGTFGGGGGNLVDGTGLINSNTGSISTVVTTSQAKYFPVFAADREVRVDLNDMVIQKESCQAGSGWPLTTSLERLNAWFVMWHVTGISPAEAAHPQWTSTLYFDTNFLFEDD